MSSALIRLLPLCTTVSFIALLIRFTAASSPGVLVFAAGSSSVPSGLGHQSRLSLQLERKDNREEAVPPPSSSSLAGSERVSQPVAQLRPHGLMAFRRSLMKGRTTPASAPSRKGHSAPTSRRHLLLVDHHHLGRS